MIDNFNDFNDQVTKSRWDTDRTVRFTNLKAGTSFDIEAVTRSGSKISDSKSITIITGKAFSRT